MRDSYVQLQMREALKDHVLSQLSVEGPIKAFYLHTKDAKLIAGEQLCGRVMSVFLLFTPEGIVITGDLHPCQRGCISSYGYSLRWFAGELGEDYLCEKFLERGFHHDSVQSWLEYVRDHDGEQNKRLTAGSLLDELPSDDDEAGDFVWIALERLGENYDGQGFGYSPTDAGWLCAIQQRFAELYAKGAV